MSRTLVVLCGCFIFVSCPRFVEAHCPRHSAILTEQSKPQQSFWLVQLYGATKPHLEHHHILHKLRLVHKEDKRQISLQVIAVHTGAKSIKQVVVKPSVTLKPGLLYEIKRKGQFSWKMKALKKRVVSKPKVWKGTPTILVGKLRKVPLKPQLRKRFQKTFIKIHTGFSADTWVLVRQVGKKHSWLYKTTGKGGLIRISGTDHCGRAAFESGARFEMAPVSETYQVGTFKKVITK